jgi:hypothetical protein
MKEEAKGARCGVASELETCCLPLMTDRFDVDVFVPQYIILR